MREEKSKRHMDAFKAAFYPNKNAFPIHITLDHAVESHGDHVGFGYKYNAHMR